MEELLLHNPHNHLYHQRNAEIRYTMGGYDNLEMAKQYYCQAVKLAPSNMRALHGLLLTVTQLASSPKCPQSNIVYQTWSHQASPNMKSQTPCEWIDE